MTRDVSAPTAHRAWLAGFSILVLLVVAVLVALFIARRTIAENAALDWLRRRGVEAAVSVRTLGLTRMEAQVRLGPKGGPALSVESIEMDYHLTGPWEGRSLGLRPGRLVVIAPRLSARYDGRRLTFGALQPVVDDLLARPGASEAPQPSIAIRRGRLDLATPYGLVTVFGNATVSDGRLDRFDGATAAMTLADPRFRMDMPGGARLSVTREGRVLAISLKAPFDGLRIDEASTGPGVVSVSARAPYPDASGLHGPAQVVADISAVRVSAVGLLGAGANAHTTMSGALAIDDKGQSFAGTLGLRWACDSVVNQRIDARKAVGSLQLTGVRYDHRDSGTIWQARLSADAGASRLTGAGLAVTDLMLAVQGQASDVGARLDGRLSAQAGATRKTVAKLDLDRWTASYAHASGEALREFAVSAPAWHVAVDRRGWQIALPAPIVLAAQSGPRLTISEHPPSALASGVAGRTKGAFDATLAGGGLPELRMQASGWSASEGRIDADLSAQARGDLDLARDARADVRGHAILGPQGASFALSGCARVSAATAGAGDGALTQVSMRFCPDGGPLAAFDLSGWRIRGRIENGAAVNAAMAVRVADVTASLQAAGRPGGQATATARVARARLSDLGRDERFMPVAVTGQATIDGDAAHGTFALATPRGQTLADVTLVHDLRGGAGRARVASPALAFAANGLQPSDISPMLRMMRRTHGHVGFNGAAAWSARGMTSSGILSTRDLGFTSPVGDIVGAAGDIALTSLAPLTTAPNQTITAKRVDGVVSITDLKVGFDASATTLDIGSADATLAAGHASVEPFHVDLGPAATWRSALVLHDVDAGRLIAASSLAKSVKLDAVVDGRLPFEAGPAGVRFTQGRLEAVGPGRLTIARAALASAGPTATGAAVNNAAQDFAYQALEDLAFDSLDASLDSVAGDRLRVLFHIKGRHDPPARMAARVSLWSLLRGKAFERALPLPSDTKINLTLDTSLNFGELIRSLDAIWSGGVRGGSPPVQGPGPP